MKALLGKIYDFFTYKSDGLSAIAQSKVLSRRSIKILIWVRIISKIYMWLLALYLISQFASFLRRILIH